MQAAVSSATGLPVSNKSGCYPRVTLATTLLYDVAPQEPGALRRTSRGMTRRLAIGLALAAVLLAAPAALATPSGSLVVSGRGGQSAVLTVPAGGLVVTYPPFAEPRVPGPDGAVSGVVIQRVHDLRPVGGVILQNAPGFDRAITIPLVDFEQTVLAAGRYRITLLGTGRQSVHLAMRRTTKSRHLVARGSGGARTRVIASTTPIAATWSEPLGRINASDYVIVGAGSAGELQQASENDVCLRAAAVSDEPCLDGAGTTVTPGEGAAGTWSEFLYRPGSIASGSYVFTGNAIGVGPSSTTGHSAVVISLRR
ncbi:MAG: hypothetical protein QOI82_2850 [Actinomycetota bacterium]|nr:hypothetical protein [Actinomycetota bacterium]